MSTNLYWLPLSHKRNDAGNTALKWALQKRFSSPLLITMTPKHLDYLQGLFDAGLTDAKILINAIEKHGEIEVFDE